MHIVLLHFQFKYLLERNQEFYLADFENSAKSGFLSLFVALIGVLLIISWVIYAYYNPHTPSGQFLIRVIIFRVHIFLFFLLMSRAFAGLVLFYDNNDKTKLPNARPFLEIFETYFSTLVHSKSFYLNLNFKFHVFFIWHICFLIFSIDLHVGTCHRAMFVIVLLYICDLTVKNIWSKVVLIFWGGFDIGNKYKKLF